MLNYVRGGSCVALCCVLLLSGCGGGGNNPPGTTPQPGSIQLSAATLSVDENVTAQLTITRTGGSDGAVSVTIASSDGTASAGADYTALNSTVSFAAGDGAAKTVTVTLADDGQGESDETLTVTLSAPTGGARLGSMTSATITVRDNDPPVAPDLQVTARTKQLRFSWTNAPGATSYRLLANPDGASDFTQVATAEPSHPTIELDISVHLHDWVNARYRLEACNTYGCSPSTPISAVDEMIRAIGYLKASNTQAGDYFGHAVALSADGRTLAVSAPWEDADGTPDGLQSGAVYVFKRVEAQWAFAAYLKATQPQQFSRFGYSLAVSANGEFIVMGAPVENANGAGNAGAIYVFTRDGAGWTQRFHTNAPLVKQNAFFGDSVAISADGAIIGVGAQTEPVEVNGTTFNQAGAAYVYIRDGAGWAFHERVIAAAPHENARFGDAVALSADGTTLAVGALLEQDMGSVHVFTRDTSSMATPWPLQQRFVGTNTEVGDSFGFALALSADGNTLAVGALGERSASTGVSEGPIDADHDDDTAPEAGAAYVFARDPLGLWSQQVYVKAFNAESNDNFGSAVSLSQDGHTLAVGAPGEDGDGIGVGEDRDNNEVWGTGAVYLYEHSSAGWSPGPYVKASNSGQGDFFGFSVTLSGDGATLAVGALWESSSAIGLNGDQQNDGAVAAGAVYVY